MRKVLRAAPFVLAIGLVTGFGLVLTAEEDKAKFTIDEVMEKAHGGGANSLLKKAIKGDATAAQKKELLALYEALAKNAPPKGSKADWTKRTSALVMATKELVADKAGAGKALEKASACGACHKEHKPD